MQNVPDHARSATFVCALVLLEHDLDPMPTIATGSWHGEILREPRGSGGFGYDPLFFVPGRNCTAAELPEGVKNTLSHRAQATKLLFEQLRTNGQLPRSRATAST